MVISWSFDRPLHHVWQLEWETVVQTVFLLANSWTDHPHSIWMFWNLYPSEDMAEAENEHCEGKL